MPKTSSEFLLVDGHSIIFAWPELRALQRNAKTRSTARESLINTLTQFQDQSGIEVVLVFDGQGSGKKVSESTEPGGIQIFYAPAQVTADSVIERLVAKYASSYQLIIATEDRLERQTAISFGAVSIWSAIELKSRIEDTEKQFRRKWKLKSN